MTQKELAKLIQNTLGEMLIEKPIFRNAEFNEMIRYYIDENLVTITETEYYNSFAHGMMTRREVAGKIVETNPVYRRNGAEEDASVDVIITNWTAGKYSNTGTRTVKIRLRPNQKPGTIVKKVRKFIEENYK